MQPQTLQMGNTIATPNANVTPAQTAAASAAGWKPSQITTTLNGANLGAVVPFNPQNTQVNTNSQNSLGASVAPAITSNSPNRDDLIAGLLGADNEPSKSENSVTEETNAGVPTKLATVNSLSTQAMSRGKYYDDQINSLLQNNPNKELKSGVQEEVSMLTRQKNSELADLSIQQKVAQDDYQGAMDIATKKVTAEEEARTNEINKYKDAINALDTDPKTKELLDEKLQNMKDASDLQTQKDLKDYQAQIDAKDPNKIASRDYQIAQTNKLNIENAQNSGNNNVSILDGNGSPINLPITIAPYYNTSNNGIGYINASDIQGTASDKKKAITDAQNARIKVILDKNQAADLTNIKDASSKLDTINTLFSEIDQPNALARDLGGAGLTQLGILAQTDPKAAVSQSTSMIGLDILKAVSGVQGFRGNQSAIQQVQDHLPKATDTSDVVKGKIEFIQKLITDRENAILGKPKDSKTISTDTTQTTKSGNSFDIAGAKKAGYTDQQIKDYLSSH